MKLGQFGKVLVALATAWLPAYMIYFVVTVFTTMSNMNNGAAFGPESFSHLFAMHAVTMLISMCLLVFYLVHIVKNQHLTDNNKLMWGLLLLFGGIITMPVYLVMHILPKNVKSNHWTQ